MSDVAATLSRFVAALGSANAEYMIVGSFASTYHGAPRTTHDIDVVVEVTPEGLERMLSMLAKADWYVDAEAARVALRQRRMFNVVDLATGWKVDVVVRKRSAFAQSEFARRQETDLLGVRTYVATAEDTILSKLAWARASGGSERQLRDAAGIVEAQGPELDRAYLERWAAELGVSDLLRDTLTRVR